MFLMTSFYSLSLLQGILTGRTDTDNGLNTKGKAQHKIKG